MTAYDVLLTKSSLSPGATTWDHLNSIVVGSITGSGNLLGVVDAQPVEIAAGEVMDPNVAVVQADVQEPEAVVASVDQEPVTAILLPVETQVSPCP